MVSIAPLAGGGGDGALCRRPAAKVADLYIYQAIVHLGLYGVHSLSWIGAARTR